MRNVHLTKRPIVETVNSKVEEQLIGRRVLFETSRLSLLHRQIVFW